MESQRGAGKWCVMFGEGATVQQSQVGCCWILERQVGSGGGRHYGSKRATDEVSMGKSTSQSSVWLCLPFGLQEGGFQGCHATMAVWIQHWHHSQERKSQQAQTCGRRKEASRG